MFDTVIVVDWSAGEAKTNRPQKDAIWIGHARYGKSLDPIYCKSRQVAEEALSGLFGAEIAAGRRVLAAFDFPFGYPAGFAARVTGSDDPLRLWSWLEPRMKDDAEGRNNRFALAEKINAGFRAPGPYWGKPWQWDDRFPELPRTKIDAGVSFEPFGEWRACEEFIKSKTGKTTSSCFQLYGNPTVGGQLLTGLPVLERLRRRFRAKVWPFEATQGAALVFAEIWPSLIEPAVAAANDTIRDRAQVTLLAQALGNVPQDRLSALMDVIEAAQTEGWILGAGAEEELLAILARTSKPVELAPPPLQNDCFAMPPGVDWTPVDVALTRLQDRLHRVVAAETVSVWNAGGRILAEDVRAVRSHPPAANAAVDGYGFAHKTIGQGDQTLPLVSGRAAAGAPYAGAVPEGKAVRILTGALLPAGVDTVVLEEDCATDGTKIAFRGPLKPGSNTRAAGEDLAAGDLAMTAGTRLTPGSIATLAATGIGDVPVYRPLRVGVMSTGDEVVAPGSTPDPARTYDANRPMLLALLAKWGMAPVDLGHVGDDAASLAIRFDQAASTCDAILTSGGASAGDEDHVAALLGHAGTRADWRIALKPGRPLVLGLWNETPVFGLPGNPVAALVCTLIFARPAFGVLSGEGWTEPDAYCVPAAFSKSKKPGRREYLRARLRNGAAEVFASEGSGRVSGLAWASGLVELPDEAIEITPGTPVTYLPFSGF
ncbi:MAG: molybdopterin-binding protein [Pseudomonadota bacterium]